MGEVIVHFVFLRMCACIYNCYWNFDMHFMSSHFNDILSIGSIWDMSAKTFWSPVQHQSCLSFQYSLNWFIIHQYVLKSEQVYSPIYCFSFLVVFSSFPRHTYTSYTPTLFSDWIPFLLLRENRDHVSLFFISFLPNLQVCQPLCPYILTKAIKPCFCRRHIYQYIPDSMDFKCLNWKFSEGLFALRKLAICSTESFLFWSLFLSTLL